MKYFLIGLWVLIGSAVWGAAVPLPGEFLQKVRLDHPRLFINQSDIPALRDRANGPLKKQFDQLLHEVDALPMSPKLEFKPELCRVQGHKIHFKRLLNDQNACIYAVKTTGGHEALKSALCFVVTGKEIYRQKALAYIKLNIAFTEYSRASRMLYEWNHYTRLNAIIAYDWIAATLTTAEKKALMKPMLHYIDFMQQPGFKRNIGSPSSGNYGETALTYYIGLACYRDGIDDELAAWLLQTGYRHFVAMMDYRDYVSGGSGVLSSICAGYSFGLYPSSSFNFLRTLKSAAQIDGTKIWTQLLHYPQWFLWAVIPGEKKLLEYGFGDSFHIENDIPVWKMYSHMAQIIDLFGKSHPETAKAARAVIGVLPPEEQLMRSKSFPILDYLLKDFKPQKLAIPAVDEVLHHRKAELFRNAGLVIMRSGFDSGATFAAFKAGARFVEHQHYDENSFIIYHRGFQALDTGARGPAYHHKVYFPQSVAHNTMLIRSPGEALPGYWYTGPKIKETLFNDGGQNQMGTGRNLGFTTNSYYSATGGDATKCYSAQKCREATRIMVMVQPNYFVIYDRIKTVTPEQKPYFLWHSAGEMKKIGKQCFQSGNGQGGLQLQTLLPAAAKNEIIGGPGKEFWTNGKNYLPRFYERYRAKPNCMGRYRLEIADPARQTAHYFLNFLQTGDRELKSAIRATYFAEKGVDGVKFTTSKGEKVTLRFKRHGASPGTIQITRDGKILLDQELFPPASVEKFEVRYPARIDVIPDASSVKLQFVDIGTSSLSQNPRWLKKGRGALVQFNAASELKRGEVTLRVVGDGKIHWLLRGPDMRHGSGARLKKYVEFAEVKINGRSMISTPCRVWHDSPHRIDMTVQDGDILHLTLQYRIIK